MMRRKIHRGDIHMAKHQSYKDKLRETEFKKRIFESLKAARQQGLLQGTRAILKVIGDKIVEENDMSAEEKLADIMKFINTSLEMTDKTVQEAEDKVAETRKPIDALGQDEEEKEEAEVVEVPDEAVKQDQEDDDE